MDKVRIGIVGMGNMGRFHAQDLRDGKVEGAELVAVASTSPEKLKEFGEEGLKVFGGGEEMIQSGVTPSSLQPLITSTFPSACRPLRQACT